MVTAIYGVVAVFVAARALRAMAVHKAVYKARRKDPSMQFAVVEEGLLLHRDEVEQLAGLSGEERIRLISTAMRRHAVYVQKAAQ